MKPACLGTIEYQRGEIRSQADIQPVNERHSGQMPLLEFIGSDVYFLRTVSASKQTPIPKRASPQKTSKHLLS